MKLGRGGGEWLLASCILVGVLLAGYSVFGSTKPEQYVRADLRNQHIHKDGVDVSSEDGSEYDGSHGSHGSHGAIHDVDADDAQRQRSGAASKQNQDSATKSGAQPHPSLEPSVHISAKNVEEVAVTDDYDDGDFEQDADFKYENRVTAIPPNADIGRYKNLLLVSTLDGKLSALDADNDGDLIWSINVGAKPLLSSSISSLEVIRNGLVSRLIPSLDGSLYQFNGDEMERLPFTADTLLSSSSKLTEDTMVVGNRDIVIFGINPYSGQVRYICGADGCGNNRDSSDAVDEDIITVRRKSHTLRAIHITTGEEQWNFSVGQHELEFLDGFSQLDDMFVAPEPQIVQVYVADGIVVVNSKDDAPNRKTSHELWRYQFPSPITRAWRLINGALEEISMFDCKYVPALYDGQHILSNQPMLFFGMHHGQLYVQPSVSGAESPQVAIDEFLKSFKSSEKNALASRIPRIKWRPYLATSASRTPITRVAGKLIDYDRYGQVINDYKQRASTEEDYPYDSGYYLIPDITYLPDYIHAQIEHENKNNGQTFEQGEEVETDYLIFINESIWVWWKEIVAISLCTSILVQVMMNHLFRRQHHLACSEGTSSSKERTYSESSRRSDESSDHVQTTDVFVSRFHADFDVIETLGKGGFGVVFRAKNKMDELEYAVKRICVKNTPESREKVLREARAMAKLEHVGIIRYYQVFVETPPVEWQRQRDLELFGHDATCTLSGTQVTNDTTTEQPSEYRKFANPLHLYDETSVDSPSLDGSGDHNQLDQSLEIVFENSEGSSAPRALPFSHYASDLSTSTLATFDSGCPTQKEENHDSGSGSSISTSDPEVSRSLTSGSGSFEIKRENSEAGVPAENKPPKLYLYIQMQLCQRETLKDWLGSNTLKRDYAQLLDYFTQIVTAVAYVHDCALIHRDLKPSNIFFSQHDRDVLKIGDFGLVTAHEEKSGETPFTASDMQDAIQSHTNQVGTQLYMSPEQINGLPYGPKVDIYSLGLIFLEFFYPCATQMERISVLRDARRQVLPTRFLRELKLESRFVNWLLSVDPAKRPTAVEVLDSSLLRDVIPSSNARCRGVVARKHRLKSILVEK